MLILGIVGSPRKNGKTSALVDAALEGAVEAGAWTQKVFLADYDVKLLLDPDGNRQAGCPDVLSTLCEESDAIILGAPVYYGDINGLTKAFMDSVRIGNSNGKPALGFAIAGGSGKGLISGVQSIYHFFYHRQLRAINPTPVSRFNLDAALNSVRASGAQLVDAVKTTAPFSGADWNGRWGEVLAYYATLPYLNRDPLDEFVMLAEQLIRISTGDEVAQAQAELDQARVLIDKELRSAAAPYVVRAYELLYFSE